jgi:hypothetical protein
MPFCLYLMPMDGVKHMTTFRLKLLAVVSMVIDHVGLFFFPQVLVLRIVGRLAFPLFAWLIANGAYHTKDIKKYFARIFLFALISQIPYLAIYRLDDPNFWKLNVLFTLCLGIAAIVSVNQLKNRVIAVLAVILIALIATLLNTDYGACGVLSILVFYMFYQDIKKIITLQVCLFILFYVVPVLVVMAPRHLVGLDTLLQSADLCPPILMGRCLLPVNFSEYDLLFNLIEPLGLFSVLFIALYRNKEGRKMKSFFYLFYPVHLAMLYFIKLLFYSFYYPDPTQFAAFHFIKQIIR